MTPTVRTFDENLALHDAAQKRVVEWLRSRGWAVTETVYDSGRTYTPDARVTGTDSYLDFKLHHTVDLNEILYHLEMIEEDGAQVYYLLDCHDARFSPCVVPVGRWILDDEWTEPCRLARSGDPGRKVRHPFHCTPAVRAFW